MEAHLHGLRAFFAPTVQPDETECSRKQLMQHRQVEIDGVIFTTGQTPPFVRPRTRQFTRRANYHYPAAI